MEGSKAKKDRDTVAALQEVIKGHTFHIEKLEAVTRLLDNESLSPDDVDALKDDIEYYVEQWCVRWRQQRLGRSARACLRSPPRRLIALVGCSTTRVTRLTSLH